MFFDFTKCFDLRQLSKFDELLKKKYITIEEIFDVDDILNELKGSSSSKFADFLIQNPQEYSKMIYFIIQEIPDECSEKNRYIKLAFYASEILGFENEKLINLLFEQSNDEIKENLNSQKNENNNPQEKEIIRASLLDNLLKLLKKDSIPITTAGYFSQVINTIINKRGHCFWEYLIQYPDILSNLFKHADIKHIVDIFEKLIILDQNQKQSNQYINERKDLLHRLVTFLKGKQHSLIIIENICELFVELYKKSYISFHNYNQEYKKMLAQFSITTTPLFFMNLGLATQQSQVYQVLNVQFQFLNNYYLQDQSHEIKINLIQLYQPIIQLFEKAITQVNSFSIPFITSNGSQITPLGDAKLQVLQLIIQFIQLKEFYPYFTAILFSQIINLVKKHPNNNQLHLLFEKMIVKLFQTQDEYLHRLIFEDTNLLLFIIQNNNEQARKNKQGFQGILTKISNYLDQNKNTSKSLQRTQNLLKTISDWDEYIEELVKINQVEQQWIFGINPKQNQKQIQEEIMSPNKIEQTQKDLQITIGIQSIEIKQNNQENNIEVIQIQVEQQYTDESNLSDQISQENLNNHIDKYENQEQLTENLSQQKDPEKQQQQEAQETQKIYTNQSEIEVEIIQSQDALIDQVIKNEKEQIIQNIEQENQNKEEPKQLE